MRVQILSVKNNCPYPGGIIWAIKPYGPRIFTAVYYEQLECHDQKIGLSRSKRSIMCGQCIPWHHDCVHGGILRPRQHCLLFYYATSCLQALTQWQYWGGLWFGPFSAASLPSSVLGRDTGELEVWFSVHFFLLCPPKAATLSFFLSLLRSILWVEG